MFEKITDNVEIHQTLPDTPNMTTQELKKEWDKGCKIIKEAFNSLVDELNNNMFPIGFRMYVNNDKDYSNHLGFTWQRVAKGKVLVGKDEDDIDFNTIGKIGGKKEQELRALIGATNSTTNRIGYQPTDKVVGAGGYRYSISGNDIISAISEEDVNHSTKVVQKDASTPTTLQPYEVVNIWERIL